MINGEVILRYIDSLSEYDEQQEKLKKKKVQISNRVTTVNYDKEAEVKTLYDNQSNWQGYTREETS